MKRTFMVLCCMLIAVAVHKVMAWGFWGHQRINRMAVFVVPEPLVGFYKKNIAFIEAHAVDPDKRRYADPEEAPRHFMDVDHYADIPFDSLMMSWTKAVAKFGQDSLKAHGIVPWHIQVMMQRLTKAFESKDKQRILKVSAELGHYVADAHVPLHCTQNYNGQLTGQHGIHGFWESRLPELYGNDYDYIVGAAVYIKDPVKCVWNIIKTSYAAKDSVLRMERSLNAKFPADRKYSYEPKGGQLIKVYSAEYSKAFADSLDGMVERRMREAILAVGSCWYTAWINAGMPLIDDEEVEMGAENDSVYVKRFDVREE